MSEEENKNNDPVSSDEVESDVVEETEVSESAEENTSEEVVEEVDYKDQFLRLQAEFINFKKREAEEKAQFVKYAAASAIEKILPGVDHMQLAIAHAPEDVDKNWFVGLDASYKSIVDGLKTAGLKRMNLVGDQFDPNIAECVSTEVGEKDFIMREVQGGYKFHDKVIRLAKVVVGNGEKPE
jgi:molecular chaperone GrpE